MFWGKNKNEHKFKGCEKSSFNWEELSNFGFSNNLGFIDFKGVIIGHLYENNGSCYFEFTKDVGREERKIIISIFNENMYEKIDLLAKARKNQLSMLKNDLLNLKKN